MSAQLADVIDKTFDYVICGAGTAGLALAARLTEDPGVTVVVLEAGEPNLKDSLITMPGQFAHTFGNPKYDWFFQTTKQKYSKDKQYFWSRGKGIGGSSAINFYVWVKPPAEDVDAIEQLGNPGWNWKDYSKYSRLSETFHPAMKEQADMYPHTYKPEFHGFSGPIQTTIPHHVHTIDKLFQQTMVNKGLRPIEDPYGGDITGTWIAASNLDPTSWTRSNATTAYYLPFQQRQNFLVLPEATVARVLLTSAVEQEATANGVEFIYNGRSYHVYARKEVIISAGAIKSPQILELSGIGRPEVLKAIGVDLKIDLPGVGENVQEHSDLRSTFELKSDAGHKTLDLLRDPVYAAEALRLYALGQGPQRVGITSLSYIPSINLANASALLTKAEKNVAELKASASIAPGLAEQLDLQLLALRNNTLPDVELAAFPGYMPGPVPPQPGKTYVSIVSILCHPFSRGTIHAISKNPLDQPTIDPHYFENDIDLDLHVQLLKFGRSLAETEPFKSDIVRELSPGPECTTDDQIKDFIYENLGTTWHTIGSCSMLPKDKGGVVDPTLKVYGTTNLRVVDLSILPLHIAAHTHATAYVIGEKAADIIRGHFRE